MDIDRQPPMNHDAERSVLGAMLLDSEAAMTAVAMIPGPEAFYSQAHQDIFRGMADIVEQEGELDAILVLSRLKSDGTLESAGGGAYLSELTGAVPTSANIEYYAKIVVEYYVLRQVIETCSKISTEAYSVPQDIAELTAHLEARLEEITKTPQDAAGDAVPVSEVVEPLLDEIKAERDSGGRGAGVLTGVKYLDSRIGGMKPGELVLIAARPSVGKTALLMNMLTANLDHPVLFFSLEMDRKAITARLLSIISGESVSEWERGYQADVEAIRAASHHLKRSKLFINDRPGLNIRQIRMHVARHVKSHGLPAFIAVDYIQLMQPTDRRQTTVDKISESSQGLKNLAREFEIPVVALAQISRAGAGQEPYFQDLKGSGSLEEDADKVLMLWRDNEDAPVVKAKIAKNRNGPTGAWQMNFTRGNQRMRTLRVDEETATKQKPLWGG